MNQKREKNSPKEEYGWISAGKILIPVTGKNKTYTTCKYIKRMLSGKKGYWYRAVLAIIGSVELLVALYLLNKEKIIEAAILGITGILLITISVFPFIESKK